MSTMTRISADLQGSLFGLGDDGFGEGVGLGALDGLVVRQDLGRGAWVDLLPGWLDNDNGLFESLLDHVPWRGEQRQMYERLVDVPRLLAFYGEHDPLPHPTLVEAREALSHHYQAELRERFTTAGLCLYRDGRDSVAWHGDTIGRGKNEDTMVAIVSLGSPRTFMLRPHGGGVTIKHQLNHGDLIVMGGTCQRTWEHAIPKTSRSVGPRISVQFRPTGVR